jgi:hypothetical protein
MGRQPKAVTKLVELSERIGIGVCEVSPEYLNFPGDHAHHLSYRRNTLVDEADLILMLDVDVPWIPTKTQPAAGAKLIHIDADPVKDRLGFWHFPSQQTFHADTLQALEQLSAQAQGSIPGRDARIAWITDAKRRVNPAHAAPKSGAIAMDELTAAVAELVNERTIVLFEEPSGTEAIPSVLRMRRPGSFFASGGAGSVGRERRHRCEAGEDRTRKSFAVVWRRLLSSSRHRAAHTGSRHLQDASPHRHLQQRRVAFAEAVDVVGTPGGYCEAQRHVLGHDGARRKACRHRACGRRRRTSSCVSDANSSSPRCTRNADGALGRCAGRWSGDRTHLGSSAGC